MLRESVLVVDDNPENLMLLKLLLDYEGFEVGTAESAAEALQVLSLELPGVMLTDIQMPEIDGLELIRRVRLDERTRALPILAVSANAMKENIQQAYAAGCDGYLTKPIDTPTLAAAVREQLACGRKREELRQNPEGETVPGGLRDSGFLMNCAAELEQLLTPPGPPSREQICGVLHRCAGTAGVLGYTQIATLARELDSRSGELDEPSFKEGLHTLSDLLTCSQLHATQQVH
jgi:two-component system cell cycle response regulator DivK